MNPARAVDGKKSPKKKKKSITVDIIYVGGWLVRCFVGRLNRIS